MKKRYEKPFIASEAVFATASQACDVRLYAECQSRIVYERPVCDYPYKALNIPCGAPPINPVIFS